MSEKRNLKHSQERDKQCSSTGWDKQRYSLEWDTQSYSLGWDTLHIIKWFPRNAGQMIFQTLINKVIIHLKNQIFGSEIVELEKCLSFSKSRSIVYGASFSAMDSDARVWLRENNKGV